MSFAPAFTPSPLSTQPQAQPNLLGESPFWHPDEQMLYWIDIPARLVLRANVFMGSIETWAMPSDPGCIAPAKTRDAQGERNTGLVIALRDGIYRAREWGGALELLAPAQHDPATTRFNDGKADPAGRFWAGTIYEPRNAAKAQLFCLDAKGMQGVQSVPRGQFPLELKADNATTANGLAWSPDGATLYWADTPRHLIRAWDWNQATNTLTRERVFAQWPAKPEGWPYAGRPDGAAVDVQGNYYVAMYEGARVQKLSPTGQLLQEFPVPAQCPTMPCFGGDDLKTLYLTTASHGRPAEELARLPDSGCVFSMRVDVPGLPVNFYRD
jgi:sugar lactone lactonase YvrE